MTNRHISVGDSLPKVDFKTLANHQIQTVSSESYFADSMVLVVGVVGAFTPVCSSEHLANFIPYSKELTEHWMVDKVACISAVDPFVLKAWADSLHVAGCITMLTDTNAIFACKMGLELDLSELGLGLRSNRYIMLVNDGKLVELKVEERIEEVTVTGQEAVSQWLREYVCLR